MTEIELSQYRALKNEIADLNKRIQETKEGEVVQFGTVKGSSKCFPYTPKNFHVTGIDPDDTKAREEKISQLLREREVKRDELVKRVIEIEKYISGIDDSITRTIFRLYVFDGLSQQKISKKVHLDRSAVSRRFNNYIKMHTKHIKTC